MTSTAAPTFKSDTPGTATHILAKVVNGRHVGLCGTGAHNLHQSRDLTADCARCIAKAAK